MEKVYVLIVDAINNSGDIIETKPVGIYTTEKIAREYGEKLGRGYWFWIEEIFVDAEPDL